jgi:micrococcal nuclease
LFAPFAPPAAAPTGAEAPTPPAEAPPVADAPNAHEARASDTVSYVYDGDTIMLADGRRIRYIGVDTPERDEPFYQEATELNRRLVSMKPVQLDVCRKKPQDEYGRTLARVTVDGKAVDDELLSAGLAEVFHDTQCVADCRPNWKLMIEAFRQKRGMFKEAAGEPTPAAVAERLLGHYGMVSGVVQSVGESTKAFHLKFSAEMTSHFAVTISKRDLEPFLRDKIAPHALTGMMVTVFGKVVASDGPRIFAVCPTQVVGVKAP